MRRRNMLKRILFAIAALTLSGICPRLADAAVTPVKAANLSELDAYLRARPDLDQFRLRGPFAVTEQKDREVHLSSTERVSADLFLSAPAEKAALLIFVHGHESSKETHAHQAMHVATWGMHSLALQLPNRGPWVNNGRILARLVQAIHRAPQIVDARIDVNRIILVGHSFGGSAVAVALAAGAPAAGGILLDAAGVGRDMPVFLKQINKPVMLIGADARVSSTRDRGYFYRFIPQGVAEVSIRNAAHEDAQNPSERSPQPSGVDPITKEELQISFVSALTSAAFSLSATGKFDYAWASFRGALKNGRFFNARKK
jgi:pimeloyl-ACP methyl ester carboxylesterase